MASTDVIQLTLTLKMTTQVVETSVTVNNNSPIQDYVHPDDQTQPFEMTPGFKPFTKKLACIHVVFSEPGTSEKTEETKSLFNRNEQRSKKSKTLYNCI